MHPSEVIAEFVKEYEEMIRPALEQGNISRARAVLGMHLVRRELVELNSFGLPDGVYARYMAAMKNLEQPLVMRNLSTLEIENLITRTSIQVSQLDIIMLQDPLYEAVRRRP